jgi:regulator of nucleoside diphosphate kinase
LIETTVVSRAARAASARDSVPKELHMAKLPDIFISSDDAAAIVRMLDDRTGGGALTVDARDRLAEKLAEAFIVPQRALPRGVVRLDSHVVYEELPAGPRRHVAIVNPRDADATAGRISVLSPVGRALLGNAAGAVIEVPLPAGRSMCVRIVELDAREPAAAGELAQA